MNSSRRNQSSNFQLRVSCVWYMFCWEALWSRLFMSYLVMNCCLVEFAVVIIAATAAQSLS